MTACQRFLSDFSNISNHVIETPKTLKLFRVLNKKIFFPVEARYYKIDLVIYSPILSRRHLPYQFLLVYTMRPRHGVGPDLHGLGVGPNETPYS